MKYEAVVFDMDGTLLDTLEDLGGAMNRVLARHAMPEHPMDSYRFFVGSGAARLVERALPVERRDEATRELCLREFLKEYEAGWRIRTRLYDGIPELLDALTSRGITLAVATNKPQDFAELCIKTFLDRWPFARTVGQVPGVPVKPDPTGPLGIAGDLGVDPASFLYLGDTDVDMFTAVAAGMFPVGVTWGFRPEEELRRSGAAAILHHPLELLSLLG